MENNEEPLSWAEYFEVMKGGVTHPSLRNAALQVTGWEKRKPGLKPGSSNIQIIFTVSAEHPPYKTRAEMEQHLRETEEFERGERKERPTPPWHKRKPADPTPEPPEEEQQA